jgi:hypothetical protein
MTKTALSVEREIEIEDVKAGIRRSLFKTVRSAFKREQDHLQAKELADSLGRDTGFVSRVLSGQSGGITAETAAIFLDAMGYHLRVEAVKKSDLRKSNWDCRLGGSTLAPYRNEGFDRLAPTSTGGSIKVRFKPEPVGGR